MIPNMPNMQAILKAKQAKQTFIANHPQVQTFMDNVNSKPPCQGQEVAIAVRYPDGTEYKTGVRLTQSDIELALALRELVR